MWASVYIYSCGTFAYRLQMRTYRFIRAYSASEDSFVTFGAYLIIKGCLAFSQTGRFGGELNVRDVVIRRSVVDHCSVMISVACRSSHRIHPLERIYAL
jgi:hypothetical protein